MDQQIPKQLLVSGVDSDIEEGEGNMELGVVRPCSTHSAHNYLARITHSVL